MILKISTNISAINIIYNISDSNRSDAVTIFNHDLWKSSSVSVGVEALPTGLSGSSQRADAAAQ